MLAVGMQICAFEDVPSADGLIIVKQGALGMVTHVSDVRGSGRQAIIEWDEDWGGHHSLYIGVKNFSKMTILSSEAPDLIAGMRICTMEDVPSSDGSIIIKQGALGVVTLIDDPVDSGRQAMIEWDEAWGGYRFVYVGIKNWSKLTILSCEAPDLIAGMRVCTTEDVPSSDGSIIVKQGALGVVTLIEDSMDYGREAIIEWDEEWGGYHSVYICIKSWNKMKAYSEADYLVTCVFKRLNGKRDEEIECTTMSGKLICTVKKTVDLHGEVHFGRLSGAIKKHLGEGFRARLVLMSVSGAILWSEDTILTLVAGMRVRAAENVPGGDASIIFKQGAFGVVTVVEDTPGVGRQAKIELDEELGGYNSVCVGIKNWSKLTTVSSVAPDLTVGMRVSTEEDLPSSDGSIVVKQGALGVVTIVEDTTISGFGRQAIIEWDEEWGGHSSLYIGVKHWSKMTILSSEAPDLTVGMRVCTIEDVPSSDGSILVKQSASGLVTSVEDTKGSCRQAVIEWDDEWGGHRSVYISIKNWSKLKILSSEASDLMAGMRVCTTESVSSVDENIIIKKGALGVVTIIEDGPPCRQAIVEWDEEWGGYRSIYVGVAQWKKLEIVFQAT